MFQRPIAVGLIVLFCLTLTGCGDSAESLTNELASMMDNMVADLEAGMPADKLQAKYEAISKDLKARMAKVPDPSPEKQQEIFKKILAKGEELKPRVQAAMKKHKIQGMPNLGF